MEGIREFYRLGTKVIHENVIVAGVYNPTTGNLTMHFSRCAECDKYDKQLGKKMALGRAQKNPLITMAVKAEDAGRTFRIEAESFLIAREFYDVATKPAEIEKRATAKLKAEAEAKRQALVADLMKED